MSWLQSESTMERFYRVNAQSAEWYAQNICRGSDAAKAEWLKLAASYRKKQMAEQQARAAITLVGAA